MPPITNDAEALQALRAMLNEEQLAGFDDEKALRGLQTLREDIADIYAPHMPEEISTETALGRRSPRVQSIAKNFELLSAILDRHEGTISRRWSKKTKAQRLGIVLTAWGGPMSKNHRPEFYAIFKRASKTSNWAAEGREAFIWPYINQEDLTKPRILPLFLAARGRHHPAEYATTDLDAMHTGREVFALLPARLDEYIMVFKKCEDLRHYGQLLPISDVPNSIEGDPSAGDGLLVLEAQERVLSFLVACSKLILHDLSEHDIVFGPLNAPPSHLVTPEAKYESLAAMAAETPYLRQSSPDFGRIASILAARRDKAIDHLWALREDPAYFETQTVEFKEHRPEMLPDTRGREHPLFRFGREDLIWNRALEDEIVAAYEDVEDFTELHSQADSLRELQTSHAEAVAHRQPLPKPYNVAIWYFGFYLRNIITARINRMKLSFVASPPVRKHFARNPENNPDELAMDIANGPVPLSKSGKLLFDLLRILWEDSGDLNLLGTYNVVDELQRLIEADTEIRGMISCWTAALIGDLAILCECCRQSDSLRIWTGLLADLKPEESKAMTDGYIDWCKPRVDWWAKSDANPDAVARYGAPVERKFYYPINKRMTEENVNAMRKAEGNLDEFWRYMDNVLFSFPGRSIYPSVEPLLSEPRAMQRTPPWTESVKHQSQPTPKVEALLMPLSHMYLELQQRTEKTLPQVAAGTQTKVKPKTHGIADPALQEDQPQEAIEPDPITAPANIFVDKRSLKVFNTIFFTPSITSTPGEVAWQDFLYAMESIGFAPQKLGGSVWDFKPVRIDLERGIQFHEPHSSNTTAKIPYRTARRHGRRLNRAYGWSGDMFKLAENSKG